MQEENREGISGALKTLAAVVIVFLLLAALYVGYQAMQVLFPPNTYETALLATVEDTVDAEGVLLFEESYVAGGGTLGYLVADGERVSAGTAVAEIYSDAAQATLRQQLTQINDQIDLLQRSQNTTSLQLDALLREKQYKLCGILNGIDMDANDPATDKHIPFNYSIDNFEEGKAKCKEALQDKFGLHKDGSPVFGMVSRMVGMKGFDLVQSVADGLVDRGIELVILGSGESQYENFFSDLCGRHPGRVGTYIGFEPTLSQEIYAGADAFIMPSKSEPCGLAQMVACRYGTPPIIRETGGLRDSIHDCTLGEGNGFTFAGYSAHELYDACCRAQDRYYSKEDWHNLVKYDMECDFSWDVSAKSYEGLYNETANLW